MLIAITETNADVMTTVETMTAIVMTVLSGSVLKSVVLRFKVKHSLIIYKMAVLHQTFIGLPCDT